MEICGGGELEGAGIVMSLFASPLYFNQTSCVSPLAATFISGLNHASKPPIQGHRGQESSLAVPYSTIGDASTIQEI